MSLKALRLPTQRRLPTQPRLPARQRLLSWRWPLAVLAAVLLAAFFGLVLARSSGQGLLDPDAAGPDGGRALTHVLREHGVDVRARRNYQSVQEDISGANGPLTLFVARPDLLVGQRAGDLVQLLADAPVDLVLVGADNRLLSDLDLPVGAQLLGDAEGDVAPDCDAPVPQRAGSAGTGGFGYRLDQTQKDASVLSSLVCYPKAGTHGLVELSRRDGRRTTLIGSPAIMTNAHLADSGNAALAVGVLGQHPLVVWWNPDPSDVDQLDEPTSLSALLPDGVRFGAVQLALVLGVVVLWRGRRLGRLVFEPLPVQVRAIETTRGRAQLYRRARARGRAAQVLRATCVRRLAVRCGLPRTAPVPTVVDAVASMTGLDPAHVGALLVGPDPTDDPALVVLARALDALETEVHRS